MLDLFTAFKLTDILERFLERFFRLLVHPGLDKPDKLLTLFRLFVYSLRLFEEHLSIVAILIQLFNSLSVQSFLLLNLISDAIAAFAISKTE